MKSHCSTNHIAQGQGVTISSASADSAPTHQADGPSAPPEVPEVHAPPSAGIPKFPSFRYCAHVTAAGRHCRTLASIDSDFCPHHSRPRAKRLQEQQEKAEVEALAAELLGPVKDFNTPGNVHHFLGNVIQQYARKRIPRRDALALGYLCQLLLSSFGEYRKREAGRRVRF